MGLFDDPIPVQQYNPASGILGAEAPLPQYDVSLKPVSDLSKALVLGAYESAQIPAKAIRGDYGIMSVDNPLLTDAAAQFTVDFGLLPAVGMSAVAKPDANTLRMGMGGSDTASGGMRQQPSMVRDVDELGFYSQALEAAKGFSQLKGTGDQYRAMLLKAGVKPDELTFTPELEGLLSQPQVTKDELVGLLQDNRIRPQETVYYGGDSLNSDGLRFPEEAEILEPDVAYGYDYIAEEAFELLSYPSEVNDVLSQVMKDAGGRGRYDAEDVSVVNKLLEEGGEISESTVPHEIWNDMMDKAESIATEIYFEEPVLRLADSDLGYEIIGSDGTGYTIRDPRGDPIGQEVYSLQEARLQAESNALDEGLVVMGGGETRFMEYTEDGGTNYREMMLQVPEFEGKTDEFIYSGHFDEPDIVVHARTKDRNSETGINDVLYVEELQSDHSQQGRARGFNTAESSSRRKEIEEQLKPLQDDIVKLSRERDTLSEFLADDMIDFEDFDKFSNPLDPSKKYTVHRGSIYEVSEDGRETLVLSSSRIENDYLPYSKYSKDFVEISSEINDINKSAAPLGGELRELPSQNAPNVAPFVKNSQKFAEVGIKRLLNQAVKENKDYVSFSSGDIQVDRWNEKGLVPFYDEIIPKVAKKVVKKLDPNAKPDYMPIDGVMDFGGEKGTNRFTIKITPKMREEILKGQQLFTAPNVPVPASGLLGGEKYPDDATEFLLLQDRLAAQGIGLL